jgi:hypothetical protein
MSYLNSPRLTFAGQFQADPSTVNNDPYHFDNENFRPNYQEFNDADNLNGWWNPDGTGSWRFLGCTVTSVTYKDGTTVTDPKKDPIIGMWIMDADSRVAGKIVDLDSQQQSVSMLWGVVVRIVSGEKCLVKGDFEPIAFTDIWWVRSATLQASAGASAAYQSVLSNLEWSDFPEIKSRYLDELKQESPDRLSIKFNVDTYSQDKTSSQFTLGRVVGNIGPSKKEEPKHFTIGRQLIPALTLNANIPGYLPDNQIYIASALVDESTEQVLVDLGNSLMTTGADGQISESRKLTLAVNKGAQDYETLGAVNYTSKNWYEQNGGIVSIKLTSEQMTLAQTYPLAIMNGKTSLIEEVPDYVRADQFVFRMNPGEDATIDFYASHLGKLQSGQTIVCEFQKYLIDIIGQANGNPATSTPNILDFKKSVVTNKSGKAILKVSASDPKNPRGFIDGQVYALWYYIKGQPTADFSLDFSQGVSYNPSIIPTTLAAINPNNFVSILVFDSVPKAVVKKPTWKDIQPTMQQYANLYPLMSKGIFNLADKQVVDDNAEILKFVFSKEKTDPNYMPVTRDLSRDKQQMIINYLDGVLAAKGTKKSVTTRKP